MIAGRAVNEVRGILSGGLRMYVAVPACTWQRRTSLLPLKGQNLPPSLRSGADVSSHRGHAQAVTALPKPLSGTGVTNVLSQQ